MIEQDVTQMWQSGDYAVLVIDKGSWVVITRQELLDGLRRGKAWKRHAALQGRLTRDDERRGKD